jgi:hypothetical protein
VEDVTISSAEYRNVITSIFNVGTLGGAGWIQVCTAVKFRSVVLLFEPLVVGEQYNTIVGGDGSGSGGERGRVVDGGGPAVTMSGLTFKGWSIGTKPSKRSELYNFHPDAETVFRNLITVHTIGLLENVSAILPL